jgi:predicted ATPase/transcriptional regulator with XRE-family HTH domain
MSTGTILFAELLRGFRDRAELTQEELAERARISRDAVGLLERGVRRRPHTDTVTRLAVALELAADERAQFEAAARHPAPLVAPAQSPLWPLASTILVGRAEAIDAVVALFQQPTARLVTLTGPGGVGKTRLALAAAQQLLDAFADGVVFVPLAAISAPELVVGAITTALGIRERAGQTMQQGLIQALQPRHTLLVLDNFEHLLPAASLVSDLLATCSRLAVLATSRAPLHLAAEQQFAVAPLEVPTWQEASLEQILELPAVALFQERARSVVPNFAVTATNAEAVLAICRRLEGLPLAIELAAAWIKLLPPQILLERLDRRLPLLVGGPRDLPARQRAMHDTIAWSYDLLDAGEQALLRRLAVFVGGFTLAGAEAIGARAHEPDHTVLNGLARLVDASLLHSPSDAPLTWEESGTPRYTMLETVREFALDRLNVSGECEVVQRQHADYYLYLAESLAPGRADAHEAAALAELEGERPNLRAALQWALDHDDISTAARLAVALWQFWGIHTHLSEGRVWLERVLTRADQAATPEQMSPALRAKLLYATGSLTHAQAAYPRATELFTAALALWRGLGDTPGIAGCLYNLGFIAYEQGDLARANELHTEARGMVPPLDEVPSTALYLTSLGNALRAHGRLDDAKQAYAESLELWRSVGRDWGIAEVLTGLGDLAQAQGDADHALAYYRESLTLHAKLGNKLGLATCFAGLAQGASTKGQPEQVARLLGAATALREQVGAPRSPAETITDEQAIAAARAALGEDTFARNWEQGCRMPLAHLVREVLGVPA